MTLPLEKSKVKIKNNILDHNYSYILYYVT